MNFAGCLCKTFTTSILVADQRILLSTLETNDVLTRLAFNRMNYNMIAFRTNQIFIKFNYIWSSNRKNRGELTGIICRIHSSHR